MTKESKDNKELQNFLSVSRPMLIDLLGADFEKKPAYTLIEEGVKRAEEIMNQLQPFAKGADFPDRYNPRAVHALFAKAFLLVSHRYEIFIKLIRVQSIKSTSEIGFPDRRDFVMWMLETFRFYEYASQFSNKTVRHYHEMNKAFKRDHFAKGLGGHVEDQLILVVDFSNPIDHILDEMRSLLEEAQSAYKEAFQQMLDEAGVDNCSSMESLPVSYGCPLSDEEMKTTRTPRTYLPQWHQAFQVFCLKNKGFREPQIIKEVFNEDKDREEYQTRKTTVFERARLADRLIEAAFLRKPLTTCHKKTI